jgi:hypothetical protein
MIGLTIPMLNLATHPDSQTLTKQGTRGRGKERRGSATSVGTELLENRRASPTGTGATQGTTGRQGGMKARGRRRIGARTGAPPARSMCPWEPTRSGYTPSSTFPPPVGSTPQAAPSPLQQTGPPHQQSPATPIDHFVRNNSEATDGSLNRRTLAVRTRHRSSYWHAFRMHVCQVSRV